MLDNRSWFSIALMAVVATVSCGGKGISDGAAGAGVAGFDEAGFAGAVNDRGGAASGGAAGGELTAGFGGTAQAGSSGGNAGAAHGGSLGVGGTAHGGAAHGGAAHGGAAHGGAAHGGASGTPGAGSSNLGAKCTNDGQCGAGLVCLSADGHEVSGGGPAGGLCTAECTSQADCDALETGANCFNFGTSVEPKLYCLEGCAQGGDATSSPSKCHGRADFACVDLSNTSEPDPYCIPLCRADLECGPGLYCSKSTGVCSSTQPSGDPVGSPCTPSTATVPGSENCAGFCLTTSADGVTPVKGVCAEFCAGLLDCGFHGQQPGGLCYGAFSENFGILDLGYCFPACDCTADCPFPGDLCRAWPAAQQSFAVELGAPGLCVSDVAGSVALTTCGEAGAAGSAN